MGIELVADVWPDPHSFLAQDHDQETAIFEGLVLLETAKACYRLDGGQFCELFLILTQNRTEDHLARVVEKIAHHLTVSGLEDVERDHLPRKQDHIGKRKERQDSCLQERIARVGGLVIFIFVPRHDRFLSI